MEFEKGVYATKITENTVGKLYMICESIAVGADILEK